MFVGYGIFFILSFSTCTPYLTGDIKVKPTTATITPGANVSFVCETSMNICKYHWEIHNITVDARSVTKLSDHSMQLDLNTTWVAEIFTHEAYILCMSADELSLDSATIYFEYAPLAPQLECMMQNFDTMHCRWNDCDPRALKHPERFHANYEVTYQTTHCTSENDDKCGSCNMKSRSQNQADSCDYLNKCGAGLNSGSQNCFPFCSSKEKDWEYWHEVEVRLDARNHIGTKTSRISFLPKMNVILSPPTLNVQDVRSENADSDGAVKISADFPSTVRNHNCFQYCEEQLVLEIRYKKSSANIQLFEKDEEEDFWTDWTQYRVDSPEKNTKVMDDSKKLVTQGKKEVTVRRLPANTTFLLQVNWKFNGILCSGRWSLNKFIKFKSRSLKPPKFYQTAMLYFDETFPSAFLFNDEGMTADSSLILWRHTDQSYTIYQNNNFDYQLYANDEKCFTNVFRPKNSNFVYFDTTTMGNDCRMKVSAFNNLGETSTPYFSAKQVEDNVGCIIRILSMAVASIQKDSIRFKVDWIYFSRLQSVVCNTSSIEGNITVALFVWKEICEKCQEKSDSGPMPTYPDVNSFYMDVNIAETSDVDRNRWIGLRTQPLNRVCPNCRLGFSYPFQPHTAYRIAASLSWQREETVIQSPAGLAEQLFYHNVEKPNGITDRITTTNVGDSSMTVTWQDLSPNARGGPILGYKIYITKTKGCFSDGDCVSPHEDCDDHSVRNFTVYLSKREQTMSRLVDGWRAENFSSKGEFSYLLDDLTPGTHHYVGIAAINAAGTSPCLKYVTQATKAARGTTIVFYIVGTFILLALTFGLLWRNRRKIWHRHDIQGPVVNISLSSDPDGDLHCENVFEKMETSCEYVYLFDEMKPPSGELGTNNNNSSEKILFHPSDKSLIVDINSIAKYMRNASNPQPVCDHEVSSLTSDVPCSSSSTGNKSTPSSTRCEYSDDEITEEEEDTAIYTSTHTALILSGSKRWDHVK